MNYKGLLKNLFELSFREFLTPNIVKYIYAVSIAAAAIAGVLIIIGGLVAVSADTAIFSLIMGLLAFVL